jgi:N-acetylmuramoyl-L-alanine amidase
VSITVIQKPTRNFTRGPGPGKRPVRAVVLHIAEGSEASVDSWFGPTSPSNVSSHFLVGLDGEIRQYVSVHDVAKANGFVHAPTWAGLLPGNPNDYTVSIEHEGSGRTRWPEEQLASSALLSAWLCERFKLQPIPLHFPLHREIRADKSCPGPMFERTPYLARVRWNLQVLGPNLKRFLDGVR